MFPASPAHDTTRCPRCDGLKPVDLWLCDVCYQREPRCCLRCHAVDVLNAGLCATCQAGELDADTDPDAPIPFELTPKAYAALTAPQTAPQSNYGPIPSGEASCPRCGRVRGVVYDGASHRCYQCWHCWVPAPAPSVA